MKLDNTNNWLTLTANVGVLLGIVFLVYELRQNTVATELEVASNFQNSFSDIEMLIASDPEFSEILMKGRIGTELTEQEQFRLSVFYGNVLRHWQYVHFQFLSKALDEDIWRGQRIYFTMVLNADVGLLKHWRSSQDHYSPSFNMLIRSMVPDKEGV